MQFEFKSQLKEIKIQNLLTKSGKLINRSSNNLNSNWPPRNRKEKRKLFSLGFSRENKPITELSVTFLGKQEQNLNWWGWCCCWDLRVNEGSSLKTGNGWIIQSLIIFYFFYCFYIKIKIIIIIFILFNFIITWGRWWKKVFNLSMGLIITGGHVVVLMSWTVSLFYAIVPPYNFSIRIISHLLS